MRRKFLFEYDMTFMTILSVVLFIIPSLVVYGYYLLTRGKALNVVDSFFIKVFSDDISTSKMVLVYVIFIVIMFLWMVLHEIIHGIFVHLGYNDYAQNEQLVQALGNAIYQGFNIKAESEGAIKNDF